MLIKASLWNGSRKGKSLVGKLKRIEESGIQPNELMVRITVQSDMSVLSEEGIETMTDVLKAMCVVTTLPPDEISYLVERYETIFEDDHENVEVIQHIDSDTLH